MKKILLILMMMLAMPVYATTMCAVNDSVAVVLDPTIGGNNYSYDATLGTWWASFSYGTIRGISACLNSNKGKSMGGYVSQLTDVDNNGDTNLVVGSEKYGRYCWCKMTHPAASLWVFIYDRGSPASCASNCAYYCGYGARADEALRVGLFGSVAQ
jgi:hypothetical protein